MLNQRDFDFLKIIGTGSFGMVFLARLVKTNKYFAIKRMDKQLLKESRQLDNIYNEARILKETSSCPFIVKYLSFIETDTDIFLTMEYVKGGELFYYMKKYCRFPDHAVLFFSTEILLALKFLHDRDILYRDLKPENILINSDGHIKIADFGFSARMSENVYLLCGTPEYMAPEKLHGNGDSKETDYWSFGCLVYEMICGNPPFYDKSTDEIYRKILTDDIYFPDDISPTARDLLEKLLAKERESRLGFNGIEEIMGHSFFGDIRWKEVYDLDLEPPFRPNLYQFQGGDLDNSRTPKKRYEYKPSHTYRRIFKLN